MKLRFAEIRLFLAAFVVVATVRGRSTKKNPQQDQDSYHG